MLKEDLYMLMTRSVVSVLHQDIYLSIIMVIILVKATVIKFFAEYFLLSSYGIVNSECLFCLVMDGCMQ